MWLQTGGEQAMPTIKEKTEESHQHEDFEPEEEQEEMGSEDKSELLEVKNASEFIAAHRSPAQIRPAEAAKPGKLPFEQDTAKSLGSDKSSKS